MNVIIVEDEAIMMMFLKEYLSENNHIIKGTFSSSHGVFKLLEEEEIDIIFLDIMIKGSITGLKIAQLIREKNRDIKIIFITSYKDSKTIQEAKKSRPNGYLIKPISKEDLEAILMICESSIVEQADDTEINVSTYKYNLNNKTIKENNETITLTTKESDFLEVLINNKNNYISHKLLVYIIWGEDLCQKSNSLRELVYRIRKKLPNLKIENSVNIGYILKN